MDRIKYMITITLITILSAGCVVTRVRPRESISLPKITNPSNRASVKCTVNASEHVFVGKGSLMYSMLTTANDARTERIADIIVNRIQQSGSFSAVVTDKDIKEMDLRIEFNVKKEFSSGAGMLALLLGGIVPIPVSSTKYTISTTVYKGNEVLLTKFWKDIGYNQLAWLPLIVAQPFQASLSKVDENIFTYITNDLLSDMIRLGIFGDSEIKSPAPSSEQLQIIVNSQIPKETKARNISISGQVKSELGISNLWINNKVVPLKDDLSFEQSFPLGIGSNVFKIKVMDIENHSTEKEVVVKRLQDIDESYAAVSKLDSEIDNNIPKYTAKRPNAVAVIIGNKDYQKTKPVDFAINDAYSFREYCVSVLGINPKNIIYQENASKGDFETIFGTRDNPKGKLYNWASPDAEVFVYYSGHGAPGLKDKQGYFVPVECDPMYVEMSGYPLSVFYANLNALRTQHNLVFIDACFSGSNIFENVSPVYISSSAVEVGDKVTLLSSSSGTEVSGWKSDRLHGLFTYYLLRAFHDTKAVDTNNDRKVTVQELYAYISSQQDGVPYYARRNLGIEQTPTLQGKDTEMELFRY